MKMNVVDDLVIRSEPSFNDDPTPDVIGLEFVRQYYTILSKSPGCVHKFYSHESVFVHNDITVIGQQKIKNSIEQLVEANNRFKIHSVKGSFTSHKGIVLQVCGEVSTRRFFQTFILGQQSAKKYYVQNDIFQFIDVAFRSRSQESPALAPSSDTTTTEIQSVDVDLVENGHNHSHSSIALSEETAALSGSVSNVKTSSLKNDLHDLEESSTTQLTPSTDSHNVTNEDNVKAVTTPATVSPSQATDNAPKTWANRVGGGLKTTPSVSVTAHKSTSASPTISAPLNQKISQSSRFNTQTNGDPLIHGERRIYLGGIIRNMVPDNTGIAELEIKQAFSKLGDVDSVAIPRKVLDQPNDTSRSGFAFISMRSPADAQAVFQKARKDERGVFHLQLSLEAFGFEGEVTISEQKDRIERSNIGYRGGRGGFVPRGGAGSFMRGGGRSRGSVAGFRGNYHNQNHH